MDNKTKYRILAALRKIDSWTDAVKEVRERSKIGPGIYLCEGCGLALCTRYNGHTEEELIFYSNNELELINDKQAIDHIKPVVDASDGFVDWNTYISRLFVSAEERQSLCTFCHRSKTEIENQTRVEIRRQNKRIK